MLEQSPQTDGSHQMREEDEKKGCFEIKIEIMIKIG